MMMVFGLCSSDSVSPLPNSVFVLSVLGSLGICVNDVPRLAPVMR